MTTNTYSQSFFLKGFQTLGRRLLEAFEDTQDHGYATATANDRFIIPEGSHWNDVRVVSKM